MDGHLGSLWPIDDDVDDEKPDQICNQTKIKNHHHYLIITITIIITCMLALYPFVILRTLQN